MRKDGFAEWMLKRAAGAERGTAMYGDMVEIAAARGSAWFWMAYARTLIALTWRTAAAILAVISVQYLRGAVAMKLLGGPISYNDPRLHAWRVPYLAHFSWDVSIRVMFTLWIVLPYVAMRFGLRNRLTYLAGVLLLLSVPVYTLRAEIYQITGVACAAVILAALASVGWRRQMIFVLANLPITPVVFYFSVHRAPNFLRNGHIPLSLFHMRIDDPIAIAVTVMIGPLLHRLILENHKPARPAQLAGVAHA
jgi:hypothetical protein